MTEKEAKQFLASVKELKKKFKASPEEGFQFLIKAGILTKSGNLRKVYR